MKLSEFVKQSTVPAKLIRAVVRQVGGWITSLKLPTTRRGTVLLLVLLGSPIMTTPWLSPSAISAPSWSLPLTKITKSSLWAW